MEGPVRVWGYGDQGEDDRGYGCVYRNVQTLLHMLTRTRPPPIRTLRWILGVPWSDNKRQMWIEPRDAALLINVLVPSATTKTRTFTDSSIGSLNDFILRSLSRTGFPVLVDNGISSYLIFGSTEEGYRIGDPHHLKESLRRRVLSYEEFFSSPRWMILVVSLSGRPIFGRCERSRRGHTCPIKERPSHVRPTFFF